MVETSGGGMMMPGGFEPGQMPEGFEQGKMPEGMPEGFEPGQMPEGMPEGFEPGQMPERMPEGFEPGHMPGGRGQNGFGQMNMENVVTEFEIKAGGNMYMVVSNKK